MAKNTFLLSDESVNSYGEIIKTNGIDTTRFEKNPVMFYQHEQTEIVGRWENIRKKDGALFADAVFDDTSETGKRVKTKVEKGFLRAASIGINILEEQENEKGQTIITKCELIEASIVDLPSNKNAVKQYRINNRKMYLLNIAENSNKSLQETLISLLGLEDTATDEDIINKIAILLQAPDDAATEVDNAIKDGYLQEVERTDFIKIARLNFEAFKNYMKRERGKRAIAVKTAVKNSKISILYYPILEEVGQKMGVETVGVLLSMFNRTPRISEIIDGGDRSKWTLSDYRKYRPNDLKENPKLYAALLEKEEKEKKDFSPKNLDFYRKNHPDFLRDHPDFYEELIKNI